MITNHSQASQHRRIAAVQQLVGALGQLAEPMRMSEPVALETQGLLFSGLHVRLLELARLKREELLTLILLRARSHSLVEFPLARLPLCILPRILVAQRPEMPERIQRIKLGLRGEQRLLLMLAVDVDERAGQALDHMERSESPVQV